MVFSSEYDILRKRTKGGDEMYYATLFGEKMQRIRKKNGLSRDTVSARSSVNRDTLRRIEKGEVIPKFETLELLSPFYNTDLNQLLLECRTEDTEYLNDLMNRIERKVDDGVTLFEKEKEEMRIYAESSIAIYQKKLLQQWYLFLCALDELTKDKHSEIAPQLLTESLQQTLPDFRFDKYESFTYNEQELRILMNFAFLPSVKQAHPEYIKLIKFCCAQVPSSSILWTKTAYNLSIAYQRTKEYSIALHWIKRAICSAQENRSYSGLPLLFYTKGYIEYTADMKSGISSLQTALLLCEAFGQQELKHRMKKNIIKYLHLNLNELQPLN